MPTKKEEYEKTTDLRIKYDALANDEAINLRDEFCARFGVRERTFYNRLTSSGAQHLSSAEKEWLSGWFKTPVKKLFPELQKQAA